MISMIAYVLTLWILLSFIKLVICCFMLLYSNRYVINNICIFFLYFFYIIKKLWFMIWYNNIHDTEKYKSNTQYEQSIPMDFGHRLIGGKKAVFLNLIWLELQFYSLKPSWLIWCYILTLENALKNGNKNDKGNHESGRIPYW